MAALHDHKSDTSTRDRLLDTAAALFWEKGYAATTTREIAARVGIQQASLYYHVACKEDLLYQLGVSSLDQLQSEVQSAVDAARDPVDRLSAFIHAHLSTLLKHQIRHVTVLTGLHGLSTRHRADVLALRKRYADLVRSLLEQAQAAGRLRTDIPARYLYLALLNILNWAVFWFRHGRAASVSEVARTFQLLYLEGALDASQPQAVAAKGTRKRKRPASRRSTPERMLDKAADLFSSKGYTAASTREIAASLGMRKASLYYHIKTKEDLLYTITVSSLKQIRSDVEQALGAVQNSRERVEALIAAHVESLLRDQGRHAAALTEMQFLSPVRRAEVIGLRDAYESLVRSVLAEAQTAGVLRSDIPVKYLCLALLGLLNRLVVWYRRKGSLSADQMGHLMIEVFLNGTHVSTDRQVKQRVR